jgi:hypothetical protein
MKKLYFFYFFLATIFPVGMMAQTFTQTNGTVNACSGNYYDSGGAGGAYLDYENSTFTICSSSSNCVRVTFTSFDLESGWDYLYIYDGPTTASPLIGTYTGATSPGTVTSTTGGCLTFRFTSDGSVTYTGWAATISCVAGCVVLPCLPNMSNCTANACSGNFYDTGGAAGNYANNESLVQTICSNSGNCVRVTFSAFNTELNNDILTIFDGPSTASPQIGTYSGTTIPGAVTASTGCLTFRFVTNGSVVSSGWQAAISCVACPGNFNCYINPVSNGHGLPAGFTQGCDDLCSSSLIPLGFTYNICGSAYSDMYVNMNGNITFGTPFYTYTPVGMPNNTTAIMVAPFWADVDTRSCGTVYHRANPTNTIVSWHSVGYFSSQCDKLNSFQLVISDGNDPLIGAGNNTAFYYQSMAWTTGSASSGVGGFGGSPATAGINANDGINFSQIGEFDHAGSGYDGPFLTADGVDYLDNRCFTFPAAGCTILPVNYESLKATPVDGSFIQIDWTTNSESNNLGFELQRSLDGKNFEKIAFIEGSGQQGNAGVDYSYEDHQARAEIVYWYRLKQLDLNGNFLFSPVVQAMLTNAYRGHVSAAYPNPFEDEVSFELTAQFEATCTVTFTNSIGQVMLQQSRHVYPGVQITSVSTRNLASGIYAMSISLGGRQISAQKVTK